jgi:hypothetical protein
VVVANVSGSVTSSVATLTVADPFITRQPSGPVTRNAGQSVSFAAGAGGTPTLTYQWRKNGSPLDGATNTTLILDNLRGSDAGAYDFVASNSFGNVTSIVASLTVRDPFFTGQPSSHTRNVGESVTFSVVVLGVEPLHYQWRKDGANLTNGSHLAGAEGSSLTLASVQPADAGNYSVVVSNQYGSVTSVVATLMVLPAIPETVSPQLMGGNQMRFTITGTPGRVLHLQGSPDLFHWAILGTYTNQSGTLLITNPLPSGHPAYFFRTEFVPDAVPSSSVPAPTLASPARLPNQTLRFELHATPGSVWQLQGSPDIFH